MIPVTYGYARGSKTDRNLETQLQRLAGYSVRQDLVFSDTASGRTMQRRGWRQLMDRVQEGDTIVVVWLDRFSRDFDEGLRIQAELTERGIGIVAITENINTADDSAATKYFRRMLMDNGAYQVESSSERIRPGLERARREGRPPGRRRLLTDEQIAEARRRITEDGESMRSVARSFRCSDNTIRRALERQAAVSPETADLDKTSGLAT